MRKWIIILIILLLFILIRKANATSLNEKIVQLWKQPLANSIISTCDKYARIDARHCKLLTSAVCGNESTFGKKAYKNNVCGIQEKFPQSKTQALEHFIREHYNKYYYIPWKYNPSSFYSNNPNRIVPTRYCMSEDSSKSKGFCPFGFRNSWNIWNQLINLK